MSIFHLDSYSFTDLVKRPIADLKAEYARLRPIAQKRIGRASKDKGISKFEIFQQDFKKTRELSEDEIVLALKEVQKFLADPRTTIKGAEKYRREQISTLREHGYDFVDAANYFDFATFMGNVQTAYRALGLPSDEVAEMFDDLAEKQDVNPDQLASDFNSWVQTQLANDDIDSISLGDFTETYGY